MHGKMDVLSKMCCQRLSPSCSQCSHICKGVEGVGHAFIATYLQHVE